MHYINNGVLGWLVSIASEELVVKFCGMGSASNTCVLGLPPQEMAVSIRHIMHLAIAYRAWVQTVRNGRGETCVMSNLL